MADTPTPPTDAGRTWRTNIGLRLTPDDGAWLEAHCARENRSFANYVELLIRRDRAAHAEARPVCIDCLGAGGDAGSRFNPCPTCGKARAHG